MEEHKVYRYYDMHIHLASLALYCTYQWTASVLSAVENNSHRTMVVLRSSLRVGFETFETIDGQTWKVVGDLSNKMFGHTSWACGHFKNKHSDRHHMPEAAYEIRWILSIIGA